MTEKRSAAARSVRAEFSGREQHPPAPVAGHAALSDTYRHFRKRTFDETSAKADRAMAEEITARFRTLFAALDRDLPDTPKVVLMGAAFGADLIAAETALQTGPSWAVAAILPFERALFEEDFHPASDEPSWRERYAAHATAFERILGPPDRPNPRVLVRELPKLALAARRRHGRPSVPAQPAARQGPAPQSLRTGRPAHRRAVHHHDRRHQRRREPETSEANGGTARIVAYRRAGCPDVPGAAVTRVASSCAMNGRR